MKKLLLFLVLFSPAAMAQATYTAASGSLADVQSCVNATSSTCNLPGGGTGSHLAVNGDVIIIPAGAWSWALGLTAPAGVNITITGVGTPNSLPTQVGASASCTGTQITYTAVPANNAPMFTLTPTTIGSLTRLSCMDLIPSGTKGNSSQPFAVTGTCTVSGCPNLRIDNISGPSGWAGIGISDDTFAQVNNLFGVADHNNIGDATVPTSNGVDFVNVSHGSWQGVGGNGDNSWASADTFGTNQLFYLENNLFNHAFGFDADRVGTPFGGGRGACRYNTTSNVSGTSHCGGHGTDTTGRSRGVRQMEYYRNIDNCSPSCSSVLGMRSGVAISFGNTYTGFINNYVSLTNQRPWRVNNPFGPCDGSSPWDTNDGTVYYSGTVGSASPANSNFTTMTDIDSPAWSANLWAGAAVTNGIPFSFHDVTTNFGFQISASGSNTLTPSTTCGGSCANFPAPNDAYQILRAKVCMDQPARGPGWLVQNATPILANGPNAGSAGPVSQPLDPVYEMADSPNSGHATVGATAINQIANRDFYAEVSPNAQSNPTTPFNGTTGTGYGTLANRPPCTSGCLIGVGYWATDQGSWNQSGDGKGQGELFVLTAPGTWTLTYVPFTYPHPLVVATVTVAPPTETFGSVVVGASSATQSTTLTNGTAASITISSVTTTGNTSDFPNTANTCSGTIAGNGGTCSVTTKFSPTSTGTRSATLTIATSAGSFPVALSGTGTSAVNPGVSISPAFIAFGNQSVGAPTPGTVVTITSTTSANLVMGTPPATISGTNAGDFNLQAVGGQCSNGQSIPQSSTCIEDVVFLPTATGSRTAQLNIFDNVTGSPQVVTLSGTGVGTIAINPATLNYGLIAQGQTSASQLLTITNNTGVTLSLTGTSFSNTDFASTSNTCNSGSLTNGSSCTATITFRPSATTGTNETGFFNVGYTGVGGSPVQTPLSGTVLPPIATPATNIFASNLAGCGVAKMTTFCFTATGKIYVATCNPTCTAFGPLTMQVTGVAQQ